MPYVGNTPALNYTSFEVQNFTTSVTTSYTLTHAVANELDIRLVLNNVIQQPGSGKAYTAAGTTLTLASATAGTDTMYAVYIGKAVQTVTPPDGSVSESKLQVSNSPSNGQVLSAQSGAAGGLTWAADAAGTVTGYTNGVDNRVITSSGTTTLNGESNLIFDGSKLGIGTSNIDQELHIEGDNPRIQLESTATGADNTGILFYHGGTEKFEFWHDEDAGAFNFDQSVETNGWGFNFRTHPSGGSADTVAMKIDGAGIVTKPLQPGFKITQTGALSVADGHTLFSSNTTEVKDVNADFSGGTFTAPVDGFYYISCSVLYESIGSGDTDTIEDTFVMSNGNEIISRGGKLNNALSSGGYFMSNNATTTYMDASDTCICQHYDGGTLAVHANAHASHFEGYLLG